MKKEKKNKMSLIKIVYKNKQKPSERLKISTIKDCYEAFLSIFDEDTIELKESLKVMFLNASSEVLGYIIASDGGTNNTSMDIRQIMQCALMTNAERLILCHNHPTGDVTPSIDDIAVTYNLKRACDMMGIELIEHLIISSDGCFSFVDKGLM